VTSALPQKASRDIAAGIAVTLIIFALTLNLPLIGFFLAVFIPLPVLFYRAKLGRRNGTWVLGLTSVAMTAIIGGLSLDALFYLELLVLGFAIGEMLFMRLSVERTVLYAVAVVLGTSSAFLLLYGISLQVGISTVISDYVLKSLKLTLAIYEKMGISQDAIRLMSDSMEQIQYVLVRILPALAVGSTLFVAWVNLLMARSVLLSRDLFFPDFGPLNRWKVPEVLVWGVIASALLLLFPSRAMKVIGLNGLIVFMVVYFLEGIAIVSFFFEKKQFPRFLRSTIYVFIFIQQIICLLVIGLGFFDTWLDFRRLSTPPQNSE